MPNMLDMFTPPEGIDQSWRDQANCAGTWSYVDFHSFADREEAQAICARCSVRSECLEEALLWPSAQDQGVRGGLTREERKKLREQRAVKVQRAVKHGTEGGYRTHKRRREEPCEACRLANNAAQRLRAKKTA